MCAQTRSSGPARAATRPARHRPPAQHQPGAREPHELRREAVDRRLLIVAVRRGRRGRRRLPKQADDVDHEEHATDQRQDLAGGVEPLRTGADAEERQPGADPPASTCANRCASSATRGGEHRHDPDIDAVDHQGDAAEQRRGAPPLATTTAPARSARRPARSPPARAGRRPASRRSAFAPSGASLRPGRLAELVAAVDARPELDHEEHDRHDLQDRRRRQQRQRRSLA